MSIAVRRLTHPISETVLALAVSDEQLPFVGVVSGIIQSSLGSPKESQWVIYSGETPAGFFLLDEAYQVTLGTKLENATGLRAFFIDTRFQGRGIAKMCLKLLVKEFNVWLGTEHKDLYLTVNRKNKAAYQLYLAVGFIDTKELYLGGQAGPQHIMCFKSKTTDEIGL